MREFRFGDVYRDREDGETLMYCGADGGMGRWLVLVPCRSAGHEPDEITSMSLLGDHWELVDESD